MQAAKAGAPPCIRGASYNRGMIKTLLLAAVVALSVSAHADVFNVPELSLSVDAPEGFQRTSADIVALKWKQPPAFVVGNERASTTIAADLKSDAIRPEQLGEAEKAFVDMFPKLMPGLKWVRHGLVTINGRQWVQMEMTSPAMDTGLHNIMLMTSMSGRLLVLNFNSTDRDFPTMEAALRKSVASVKVSKR